MKKQNTHTSPRKQTCRSKKNGSYRKSSTSTLKIRRNFGDVLQKLSKE